MLNTKQLWPSGWSSPVAREAHNIEAMGSNPIPATSKMTPGSRKRPRWLCFSPQQQPLPSPPAGGVSLSFESLGGLMIHLALLD